MMKAKEMLENKKMKIAALVACAVAALVVMLLCVSSCSVEAEVEGLDGGKAIAGTLEQVTESQLDEVGDTDDINGETDAEENTDESDVATTSTASQDAQNAPVPQSDNRTAAPSKDSDAPSNGGPAPAAEQPKPAPAKKWVEDTQQVWVEDKAAWTEQIPTYATKEVSICNVCRADITGNTAAHSKAHMLAGEGSGHHSEVRQEITGYDTVSHPAEGHYETKVVGGHWE